ncbi:unnamed protein product [Anisakis simplex]|uniref:Uncharacterized protein n=1 Tax=Anisakis simplex TaxID=6269 RepID=A0A3P6UAU7_ANISI|nr:unnamed protein product [Anisakis simplex]
MARPDIAEAVASGDGTNAGHASTEHTQSPATDSEHAERRARKSRWSTTKSFVPGMPTILPSNLSDDQRQAYLREDYFEFLIVDYLFL